MKHVHVFLLLSGLLSPLAQGADSWVFLKDGRICLSALEGEPLTGQTADGSTIEFGKELIQGTRTPAQVQQAVDAMLGEMLKGQKFEEHAKRFQVLRCSAVPALLKHLANEPVNERLSALYGLCFCWSPAAVEPVLKVWRGTDKQQALAAFSALERNLNQKDLANFVKDWADDPDLAKAAQVFRIVDPFFPDPTLQRVRRLMALPAGRSAVAPYLSHYFSSDLQPGMLQLLSSQKVDEQRSALIGLISANADDEKVRMQLRPLLRHSDSDLRQLAAEYFGRLGVPDDVSKLQDALGSEKDEYAKAALSAASSVIQVRAAAFAKLPATLSGRWSALKESDPPALRLEVCQDVLMHSPGQQDFPRAWTVLKNAAGSEPHHWYSGEMPEWHDRFRLRDSVQRLLLVAPSGSLETAQESEAPAPAAIAQHFIPPIDAYFDPKRASFGFLMPRKAGVFGNSVHIGDDCGWHRELRTIVSIGAGRVCRAAYVPSWGHIIVIEHRLPDETRVCSLYAHVSSFIYLKLGDSVAGGQKIAVIGRADSIENGGYGAHLHFGIHSGAYEGGTWITGYLEKGEFGAGEHGWLNPQAFLQNHR